MARTRRLDPAAAAPPLHPCLPRALDGANEKLALGAAFAAAHLLGLAAGILLRRLRATHDPLAVALAQARESEIKALLWARAAEILAGRFDKLHERRRPFFTPQQRFQILEIQSLLGWAADQTARTFRVCKNTILNWEKHADPLSQTVGRTVASAPPVRRFHDVVRSTLQAMVTFGFGSDGQVAQTLSRAGWKVSARSVARVRRERRALTPGPSIEQQITHPVIARFVNHVWMMDVTLVRSFLNGQHGEIHVAAVFDAFSRAPLVVQTFVAKPGASAMARLLKIAAHAFGTAKYVITDQGREFTGKVFRRTASRLGTRQRFGTVGRLFATARLERFWRTLKETAQLRPDEPLTIADLERRLETTLAHYVCFRAHQGLSGATPAEAFLGVDPAVGRAVSPPKGSPGDQRDGPRFSVGFLDPDRRAFPVLLTA
jgi:transposase InsO family protein